MNIKRWRQIGLLGLLLLLLAGCGNTPREQTTDLAGVTTETVTDVASLTVVRAEKSEESVLALQKDLWAAIGNATGTAPKLGTDWVGALDGAREIIIGEAKRPEYESLFGEMRGGDFLIRTVEGRTYIMAARADMLERAVAFFIDTFVNAEDGTLSVPTGEGYTFVGEYAYDAITIAGIPLADYQIAFDAADYTVTLPADTVITRSLAEEMNDALGMHLCGDILPIAETREAGGHFIVLSAHSPLVNDYSIEVKDGNVYLTGSYHSIRTAIEGFYRDVLQCDTDTWTPLGKSRKLTAPDGVSLTGSAGLVVPYDKAGLMDYLGKLYDDPDHVLSGTHAYGSAEAWMSFDAVALEQQKTFEASGQYAAIIEVDISFASSLNRRNNGKSILTDYDLSQMVSESMEHVDKGGIIGVCCHLANPIPEHVGQDSSYFRGYIGTDETVADMLTEGTELNANFRLSLEPTLRLLAAYRDNGIPVIFRPFHEMNNFSFWWRVGQPGGNLSQETMANLYRYVHDLVVNEMGCDQVIWGYCPDFGYPVPMMYAYPGDEYVDIAGYDWYTNGDYEIRYRTDYADVTSSGKIFAIFEFGPWEDTTRKDGVYYYTCRHLRDDLAHMLKDGYKLAYFQCWAGSLSIAGMRDGDVLMNDEIVLTRDDAAAYWRTQTP